MEISLRAVIACAAKGESNFMLFIESRIADLSVEKSLRTPLLEALQERGLVPLIRSSRLHFFEQALMSAERVKDLEQALAVWSDAEGDEPYVRGDVFCFEDFAHFVIFGEDGDGGTGLRAGIIYDAETVEPAGKLEAFCRNMQDALESAARESRASTDANMNANANATTNADAVAVGAQSPGMQATRVEWRARGAGTPELFKRFASEGAGVETPSQGSATRVGGAADRARAVEILEDAGARSLLQSLSEARADGRVAEMLAVGGEPDEQALVARLAAAGLVRREVQVSCRKSGRSLFRLPSPEALTMVTASNAVCSECGASVADERAEELVTPTPLASTMLKDGAWLLSSLRSMLGALGVPERETAARPANEEGEAQVLANVSGEPFLFVLCDGDFTAAHARRALEGETEAHASRLVVVATGKIQDEARARLREHARRRSRAGSDTEVVFIEGLDSASTELRQAVERVTQEALARELYELDSSAGFNVGYALAARFRLAQRKGALRDLAASAAGALAGSLREI